MLTIKIKYFGDQEELQKIEKGDWIDVRAARDMPKLQFGQTMMIPLGIAMKLPDGYEAHLVPRSSTFKNYGIIMTNSMGIIDNSYSGNNDQWHFPALYLGNEKSRHARIRKGARIAQFRIVRKMPEAELIRVEKLEGPDRGGFGSTGTK